MSQQMTVVGLNLRYWKWDVWVKKDEDKYNDDDPNYYKFLSLIELSKWLEEKHNLTTIDHLQVMIQDESQEQYTVEECEQKDKTLCTEFWPFIQRHLVSQLDLEWNDVNDCPYDYHFLFRSITSSPNIQRLKVSEWFLQKTEEAKAFCRWVLPSLASLYLDNNPYRDHIDLQLFWLELDRCELGHIQTFTCQNEIKTVEEILLVKGILTKMRNLKSLSLANALMSAVPYACRLQQFKLLKNHTPDVFLNDCCLRPGAHLITLYLHTIKRIESSWFTQILDMISQCPNLQHLGLPQYGKEEDKFLLKRIFQNTPLLSTLILEPSSSFKDNEYDTEYMYNAWYATMHKSREFTVINGNGHLSEEWKELKEFPLYDLQKGDEIKHATTRPIVIRQQTLRMAWLSCAFLCLLERTKHIHRTSGFSFLYTIVKLWGFEQNPKSRVWMERLSQSRFIQNMLKVMGRKRKVI